MCAVVCGCKTKAAQSILFEEWARLGTRTGRVKVKADLPRLAC